MYDAGLLILKREVILYFEKFSKIIIFFDFSEKNTVSQIAWVCCHKLTRNWGGPGTEEAAISFSTQTPLQKTRFLVAISNTKVFSKVELRNV